MSDLSSLHSYLHRLREKPKGNPISSDERRVQRQFGELFRSLPHTLSTQTSFVGVRWYAPRPHDVHPASWTSTLGLVQGQSSETSALVVQKAFLKTPATHEQLLIVKHSTTYYVDTSIFFVKDELRGRTLELLFDTYQRLHDRWNSPDEVISEPFYLFGSSISGANSGHQLSSVYGFLRELHQRKVSLRSVRVGIYERAYRFPKIMEVFHLYISREQCFRLTSNTIYHFIHVHFLPTHHDSIHLPALEPWIEDTRRRVWKRLQADKVVLIKSTTDRMVSRSDDAIEVSSSARRRLEAAGFVFLEPGEDYGSMETLIFQLSHARLILCSFGAILYTHMRYFRKDATVLFLKQHHPPYHYLTRVFPPSRLVLLPLHYPHASLDRTPDVLTTVLDYAENVPSVQHESLRIKK